MIRKSLSVLILAPILLVTGAPSARTGSTSISVTTHGDRGLESCDEIEVRFGDSENPMPIARSETVLSAPRRAGTPLRLALDGSGGMRLEGKNRDDYAVRVCTMAGAPSSEKAQAMLHQIEVSLHDNRLTARGPEGEPWLVYLLVETPAGAELELETENGEIGLRDVAGRVRARSENGPISLRGCSRTIEATTENGPISLSGGSGDSRLKAENGPISVVLAGDRWQGEGLVASTENGPLELKLPGRYRSGVRVEMRGASATNVNCTAPECTKANWTWNAHVHEIVFGDDPPVVRLSTENGPVSIQSSSLEL